MFRFSSWWTYACLVLMAASFCVGLWPIKPGMAQEGGEPAISVNAQKILADYTRTGEKVNCLGVRQISEIKPLDNHYLLVRARGGKFYLNVSKNACRGAARGNARLQYTTSVAQLCQHQIISVIDNTSNILLGSCGLSKFERLEKKAE